MSLPSVMSALENTPGANQRGFPRLGAEVDGFEVLAKLGEGAMGAVYRARELSTGREVALKILELSADTPEVLIQRMEREASLSQQLEHPNLVKIHRFGCQPNRHAFVVMELIEGRTLHQALADGPLSPERATQIAKSIVQGLIALHEAGFVHRDLKPSNLMLCETKDGEQVKILDFGIVRMESNARANGPLTAECTVLGTPAYMAPEQFESSAVDASADLYSLGAVIYHMLTGRAPFQGTFREIAAQQMVATPMPAPHANGLGPLAHQLLEKNKAARPASARQVLERLEPKTETKPSLRRRSRSIGMWAAGAAAAMTLFCVGAAIESNDEPLSQSLAVEASAEPIPATATANVERKVLVTGRDLLEEDRSAPAFKDQLSEAELASLQRRLRQVRTMLVHARNDLSPGHLARLKREYSTLSNMANLELGQLGRDGVMVRLQAIQSTIENAQAETLTPKRLYARGGRG